jgi:murein DD-endopeptidase MepM/ murein hydrolase activator NlpD
VRHPALLVLVAAAAVLAGGALGAPSVPEARGTALVARVTVPGATAAATEELTAPPAGQLSGPFSYPEDGSALRIGASNVSVAAQPGTSASAQSAIELLVVSLFGGEITAESVSLRATAAAGVAGATADAAASTITGLVVLGQPVVPEPGASIALADWGTLEVLTRQTSVGDEEDRRAEATVLGLRVVLGAEHGGLPAGSEIAVGSASALAAAVPTPAAAPVQPRPKPIVKPKPPPPRKGPREPGASIPGAPPELVREAPEVNARLTQGGYVFPLFGPAAFGDSFGAFRADVAGQWHHGEDLVAPVGTPVLAVSDGTVFSVGWNDLGGWRLWLRDPSGNEFYYAHLSAYSPLAVDGTRVTAGDVLGFVGDSGDAEGGVPHLHFEIHPVELLSLGYDGVVAPYPFLVAWRRAEDVRFAAGRRYVPGDSVRGLAPPAGAFLLEADDISRTSGLIPGGLGKAVSVQRQATRG